MEFSGYLAVMFAVAILSASLGVTQWDENLPSEPTMRGAPDASMIDAESYWVVRLDQTVSGTLYEEGDSEGGSVCYPDCPSDVEVDEYDLWMVNHSNSVAWIEMSHVGIDDGTTLTWEYCIGDVQIEGVIALGTLYCSVIDDDLDEVRKFGTIHKVGLQNFMRLSPNPSMFDDDVDYRITFKDEKVDDAGPVELFGIERTERLSQSTGYVCSVDCKESDGGSDTFDSYTFTLLAGEALELTAHTWPNPNRGQISVLLTPPSGGLKPYDRVYFEDEQEWTFWIAPTELTTYHVYIYSENSDSYDGLTYQIDTDLIWVSPSRDPHADYDLDGWTDFDEYHCGSDWLTPHSVPYDWDSDTVCDVIDNDDDNDGVADIRDGCPYGTSLYHIDTDGDGCKDGGGEDVFPTDPNEWSDTDGDGVGDNSDAFPWDPDEWADSDGNGVGDNAERAAITRNFLIVLVLLISCGFAYSNLRTGRDDEEVGLNYDVATPRTRTSQADEGGGREDAGEPQQSVREQRHEYDGWLNRPRTDSENPFDNDLDDSRT